MCIRDRQLVTRFPSLQHASDLSPVMGKYPLAITPYYASLIRRADKTDPIFQMCVPQLAELNDPPFLSSDPLEECHDMPVPGLVQRYPDRALLIATTTCSTYCRHCTRKRVAGTRETTISKRRLEQTVAYLREHPEIHDVIVSGGDPLTLSTEHLEEVLASLRQVPSVQIIRIGTRVPVVLPQRITEDLCAMLRKYHPIWINTHFNHPRELTTASRCALARLADGGVVLGNQTVLLAGVNDCPRIIKRLCQKLLTARVRPYYLYQCMPVSGVSHHFQVPLKQAVEIVDEARSGMDGYAKRFKFILGHDIGKLEVCGLLDGKLVLKQIHARSGHKAQASRLILQELSLIHISEPTRPY